MRFCGWVLCYYNWILRMRVGSHLFSSHGYGLKTSTQNIHKHVLWPCLVMPPATVWKIVLRSVYLPRKTSIVFIMSNITTQYKLMVWDFYTNLYTWLPSSHDHKGNFHPQLMEESLLIRKLGCSTCYYEDSTLSHHIFS